MFDKKHQQHYSRDVLQRNVYYPYYQKRPGIGRLYDKQSIRIGLALIILAILGLIFHSVLPWISLEYINESNIVNKASFNDKMELTDNNRYWGGNELKDGDIGLFDNEKQEYYIKTISLCFNALLLILILALVLLILGLVYVPPEFEISYHLANVILGVFLIFPGLFVTTSCSKFIGDAMQYNQSSPIEGIEISFLTPAGFLLFLFGFLIIILSYLLIRGEIHEIVKFREASQYWGRY